MKKVSQVLIIALLFIYKCPAQNIDFYAGVWSCYYNPGGNGGQSHAWSVDIDEYGRYYSVGACLPSNQGFSYTSMIGAGRKKDVSGYFNQYTTTGKSHFNNLYFFYLSGKGTLSKIGSTNWLIPWDSTITSVSPLLLKMYEDYQENVYLYKGDSIRKYDINANPLWIKKTKATFVTGDINNNVYVAGDSITKFDSNGNILWYYPATASMLVVDVRGNVYFRYSGNNFLTKLDSTGNLIFSGPTVVPVEFAVDTNENIYTLPAFNTVEKYDSSGQNLVWSVTLNGSYSKISADAHQNCYVIGYSNTQNDGGSYYARISSLQPPDTITTTVIDTIHCAGDSVDVYFANMPIISSAANFNVYLSDTAGNFTNQVIRGTGMSSPIRIWLPYWNITSNNYRLLVKVQPNDTTVVNIPSSPFTIYAKPALTLTSAQTSSCHGDSAILLSYAPPGGLLTGNGVYGNYFYPDSVAPTYNNSITYTYTDSNTCTNSISQGIMVGTYITPTVTFSDDTVCLIPNNSPTIIVNRSPSNSTVTINNTFTYNPNNPFSINVGSVFVPGINTIKIVSNTMGCKDSIYAYIYAHSVQPIAVTVSADTVCSYSSPVLLTGTPPGGLYNGNGVTGNYFYPDSSTSQYNSIYYTFIDSNACSQTTFNHIIVSPCLGLDEVDGRQVIILPNPATSAIIVLDDTYKKPYKILVNDLTGRLVMSLSATDTKQQFDISALAKGVYILKTENSSSKIIKLIKQ